MRDYSPTEVEKENKFSIRRGWSFYLKSQVLILIVTIIFLSNFRSFKEDGVISLIIFIITSEILVSVLSIIACLKYKD